MKCPNCEENMSQAMIDEGLCAYCGAELWDDDDDFLEDEEDEDGEEEEEVDE